jgi:hypothetical protein
MNGTVSFRNFQQASMARRETQRYRFVMPARGCPDLRGSSRAGKWMPATFRVRTGFHAKLADTLPRRTNGRYGLMPASHDDLHEFAVRVTGRHGSHCGSWRGRMAIPKEIPSEFRGLRAARMTRRALAVGAGLALAGTMSASAIAAPSAGSASATATAAPAAPAASAASAASASPARVAARPAVFKSGTFFLRIQLSSGSSTAVSFGLPGDRPVMATGTATVATGLVWSAPSRGSPRPSSGTYATPSTPPPA